MINIVQKITAGPFQENGYIVHVEGNSDCFIIDPGDNHELYIKEIEKNNLNPIGILNTHGHIDHVHAAQSLKNHYSIPFHIHENEKMILDHYPQSCLMYGMIQKEIPVVDKWLSTEDNISIGNYNLDIIRTPGHTPGGVCYQFNSDIFTGDTLFKGSIGRTDLPGGNYDQLMESLKLLISTVPSDTKVHSGHGFSTTIDAEIGTNPFLIGLN